ncbi:MAG: hypothetical protein JXR34_11750 [Bacteroidales bacterium]|nr:hypothetical protein [Bacteroidales bacterium]
MSSSTLSLPFRYVFFLSILFLSVWIGLHDFQPIPVVSPFSGFGFRLIVPILNNNVILWNVLTILLPVINGVLLNELFREMKFFAGNSYLVLLSYTAFLPLFPQNIGFDAVNLSLFFVLIGLLMLFEFANKETTTGKLINVSFMFSMASLVYYPLVWLIVIIPFAIALFRNFNVRSLFIILFSFLAPYFYLFVYFYWFNRVDEFKDILMVFLPSMDMNFSLHLSVGEIVAFILFLGLLIVGFYGMIRNYNSRLIQFRRIISLTIVMSVLFVVLAVFYFVEIRAWILFLQAILSLWLAIAFIDIGNRKFFWSILAILLFFPILFHLINAYFKL